MTCLFHCFTHLDQLFGFAVSLMCIPRSYWPRWWLSRSSVLRRWLSRRGWRPDNVSMSAEIQHHCVHVYIAAIFDRSFSWMPQSLICNYIFSSHAFFNQFDFFYNLVLFDTYFLNSLFLFITMFVVVVYVFSWAAIFCTQNQYNIKILKFVQNFGRRNHCICFATEMATFIPPSFTLSSVTVVYFLYFPFRSWLYT